MVAVAATFVLTVPDDAPDPAPPRPSTTTSPLVGREVAGVPAGPLLGSDTDTILVLAAGDELVSADLDTGDVERLGTGPERLLARGPDVVLLDDGRASVYRPFSKRPLLDLGPAGDVLQSVTPDRVWLVRPGDPITVVEVGLNGMPVGPVAAVPGGARPVAGVPGGVLLEDGFELAVLDPVTGATRVVARGSYLGATGAQVATLDCTGGEVACALSLTDVRTGLLRRVEPPPGSVGFTSWTQTDGQVSDADTIVVGVRGPERASAIARVDVVAATATALPGVGDDVAVATEPAGRWHFAAGADGVRAGALGGPLVPLDVDLPAGAHHLLVALARG